MSGQALPTGNALVEGEGTSGPLRSSRKRLILAGLVGTAVVVAVVAAILVPRAIELTRRLACQRNMKAIAAAMRLYQNDYAAEGYPPLDWFVARGLLTPEQIRCPSAGPGENNYVYVPPFSVDAGGNENSVLMYEPKSNHGGDGANVVFADGHATFVRGAEYDKLVEDLGAREP